MKEIFSRASVRKFTDEILTDEEVEKLLRAAMAAPSAMNQQPWFFYAVSDREVMNDLQATSPYAGAIKTAPLTIVACLDMRDLTAPDMAIQDISCAVENMMLEAVHLELGSVWLGVAPSDERMSAIAEILEMPEYIVPICLVPVGHPAPGAVKPRGIDNFTEEKIARV